MHQAKLLSASFLILFSFVVVGQTSITKPDIKGDINFDLGLNVWNDMPLGTDRETLRSKSVGLYYTKTKVLSDYMTFRYGIGFGLEKIDFGDSLTLTQHVDSTMAQLTPNTIDGVAEFEKNRLALTHLNGYNLNSKGTSK